MPLINDPQKTIASPITISGTGLHTGEFVTLTLKPAPVNHGYKFIRIDLDGHPQIEAIVDNVQNTDRSTNLQRDNIFISTVEHLLAAIYGSGVDNIIIEMDGNEVPILDGSSAPWIDSMQKVGLVDQEAQRIYFELKHNLIYTQSNRNSEIIAIPSDVQRFWVMIQFNSKVLDTQFATLDNMAEFKDEIAPCRTFVFIHELEQLIQHNLIKGGDINNAIVLVDKILSEEELKRLANYFNRPEVKVLQEGILNNLELHYMNEPARHKLLDLVGDLALTGFRFKAHVLATRPGHEVNIAFARKMREAYLKEHRKTECAPQYDPNQPAVLDINGIKKLLPHRPPFLLIDKILEMSNSHVVGLKNVTMNEAFFTGHFPDEPVMPGVMQIEAMAQTGGVLVMSTVPDPENYLTYFMKINEVKFRHKVVPGDTLIFSLELVSPIRRGLCHMRGKAFVGDKVVMEAEMLAQISRKTSPSNA
ncbi:MAG TPA: bifunctional UDP-3-O-[3-hydroxymyristoyl] N-acetylglucosamine deacetylase/3-hydroxyacyl-ACP dehydratase [Bacteroidales bacterium]|nr:bifunctional UDP-3-O-[3-hydroxymyristoyl] N-acetylglucosamine deacetylase/3-hydroxyacyl-ACP dehydratase [Bacteroidales bacterium]HQQ01620.1 bifunctional UDP-3-O-[3-hydroxymyristoyl] N-acetylglucosamine deacetylase/3-hydroxyacyl-ACP dehydratase [Bacteroidales bacterium]